MERGDPHLLRHRADESGHSFLHLARRLVGEGDGKDLEGRDSEIANEMCDAMGKDPGLARTGAGDDEQRALGVGDGLVLNGIETVQKVAVRMRRTIAEEGSHGAITLPAPCDAPNRLNSGKVAALGRTPVPA